MDLEKNISICSSFLLFVLAAVTVVESETKNYLNGQKVVYAVNCGGYDHQDKFGIQYEADPLHNKIGTASDYGNHLLIIGRVQESDEVLYRTERYHTATFGYDLPVDGDGNYALILKFCEVYFNEPNKKIFDVVLNKQHTIVSELDIFHQVGRGTAHEEYAFFAVRGNQLYYNDEQSEIHNGIIRLDFIKSNYDNPKINAFVLLKGDVEHIPRLAPISDDHLPMDADMAVFHDRVSADSAQTQHPSIKQTIMTQSDGSNENSAIEQDDSDEDADEEISKSIETQTKTRKTSGPRHPNPYSIDDSSFLLPVFIAIGAFIPLLFCLCKL